MPKSFTVEDDYNDSRLDKWFKNNIINIPHSLLEKILRQNKVKVNKKKTKSSYRLQVGDLIEIYNISNLKLPSVEVFPTYPALAVPIPSSRSNNP